MKNLMIYIGENNKFDTERTDLYNDANTLIKVQIDTIIDLGWKIEDVILVTNFPYEYRGISAKVIEGVEFFTRKPQTTKINAIIRMFELGMIKDNEIYFFHDLDAYQMQYINESETEMDKYDLSLTDYGRMERWNTGVMFFTLKSRDLFEMMRKFCYDFMIDEERALTKMTRWYPEVKKRVCKLNITFNLQSLNIVSVYKMAKKPFKIAHFHPDSVRPKQGIERSFDFYKGKNKIGKQLITDKLIEILANHNIK